MTSTTSPDKRAELEKIILTWSSEMTGEPREKLAPDALTLIDRLIFWHEQEIAEARINELDKAEEWDADASAELGPMKSFSHYIQSRRKELEALRQPKEKE